MRVNGDFERPALVRPRPRDWVASPMAGVERLMLDRIGGEVARATSLVRYRPGSAFSPHRHDGGEEFLVLSGVFSDELGDYPEGTYVRNPIGTSHTPSSAPGCTIFVKLRQFDRADGRRFSVDTRACAGRLMLHRFGPEEVTFHTLAAAEVLDLGRPSGGAELLVVSGTVHLDGAELDPWCWVRKPAGDEVVLTAGRAATLYLKTGHLGARLSDPDTSDNPAPESWPGRPPAPRV